MTEKQFKACRDNDIMIYGYYVTKQGNEVNLLVDPSVMHIRRKKLCYCSSCPDTDEITPVVLSGDTRILSAYAMSVITPIALVATYKSKYVTIVKKAFFAEGVCIIRI